MKAAEYMFLHACLQQYLSRIELSVSIVNVVRYLLCLIGIITMKKYLHWVILITATDCNELQRTATELQRA